MPFGRKNKTIANKNQMTTKHFIVVGAGMSGLYTSYRLHQLYKNVDISFIETLDRVGGRLLSVDIGEGTFIEKGGMRILTGNQPLIEGLIKKLDVTLYDPPQTNQYNFDFYRGQRVYPKQILSGDIPYNLLLNERGKNSEELIDMGIGLILQQNNINQENYKQNANKLEFWESLEYNKLPLTQWNVNMWLHNFLSIDAVNFVFASQGYDSFPLTTNLAIFLFYNNSDKIIFQGDTSAFKFIKDGYSIIPKKLYEIALENGDKFYFNSHLNSVTQRGDISEIEVIHNFHDKNTQFTKNYKTPNLILSLPTKKINQFIKGNKLKGLRQDRLEELTKCVTSVKSYSAYRIFPVFKDAWWREKFGIVGGRCNTNTPLKQVYFWNSPPKGKGPGVLLLYSDDFDSKILSTFMPQDSETMTQRQANKVSVLNDTQSDALRLMLSQVFQTDVPPMEKVYINWWPVAWDFYLPQNIPSQVFKSIPTLLNNISIVGVGMSEDQGWVEGALQTVELLLRQKKF